MNRHRVVAFVAAAAVAASGVLGCENLPGTRTEQATVMGGVAGGLAGAALNESNPLMGALIGGALGAGAGYLIGAKTDWFEDPDDARDDAQRSVSIAQERPATVQDVQRSATADLNRDGFETYDELFAMEQAGLSDDEMLNRLRDTGQVFDLSPGQRDALRDAGISDRVLREMPNINRSQRDEILGRPS
jgi:hypothetical protein